MSAVCTPWAVRDDLCSPCVGPELDPDELDEKLQAASDLLFAMSGRQFNGGGCTDTVRPIFPDSCGHAEVMLPYYPVTAITSVKVRDRSDEAITTLQATDYRLDNKRVLVRLEGSDGTRKLWPHQDLYQNESGDGRFFEVTYTYGVAPPQLGVNAAATLACEMYLACDSSAADKCRLPNKVQSIVRQGVSMELIDPNQFLTEDFTGIYEVDSFLKAYNPKKLRRSASVWSPDLASFRHA